MLVLWQLRLTYAQEVKGSIPTGFRSSQVDPFLLKLLCSILPALKNSDQTEPWFKGTVEGQQFQPSRDYQRPQFESWLDSYFDWRWNISELLQGQHPGHQELRQGGLNRRHRQQSHRLNFRRTERPLDTSIQIPMATIMIFLADDSLGNYFFNWPIKHFKNKKLFDWLRPVLEGSARLEFL